MHRCKHIPQPLKADPQTKAVVRASTSPTREKLFFKISFPSKNFKKANPQTDTKTFGQLVAKINTDKGCETRKTRTPGHNSRLASCGVTCLNSSAVLLLGFSGKLTVKCSEIPHERQAANRYYLS
jgi:hypothetical protein